MVSILKKRSHKKISIFVSVLLAVLIVYSATLLLMYFWGFLTSLKSISDFRTNLYGLPKKSLKLWTWEWQNYLIAFDKLTVKITTNNKITEVSLMGMIKNSVFYSASAPFITVFTTWIVAYALARNGSKFSKFLYNLNIVVMMIPIYGSLPSSLQIWQGLGLYDTWWFIIISSISFTGSNLIIFYSFFKGVGKDYSEAAKIDGAGEYRILFSIIFPLTSQMFFILFLLSFITHWNDFMTMVIWMPSYPTLAYGIYKFGTSSDNLISWPPLQITGSMLLMIPVLVLFLCFQDALIGNIRMGALKA